MLSSGLYSYIKESVWGCRTYLQSVENGKHGAGGREISGDPIARIQTTNIHSLDQQQDGNAERWKDLEIAS